ncbi:MAG: hypothetical protein QUU85_07160, partial [Candidatus Eisenbacteria bacterium]|nr:hypothetical protein [Candidatus Eisenbacteria bacterium]
MARTAGLVALLVLLLTAPAWALTLDDVVQMLEANVGEDVILRMIDNEDARFVVTSEDLIDLKNAGASNDFLDEVLDRAIETDGRERVTYRSVEPAYSSVYLSFGYDPFDYYFITWPYYYAYVSPFPSCWNWWYYSAPLYCGWCSPWDYPPIRYYDRHWGTRTIWTRGYENSRYHVPATLASQKVARREAPSRWNRTAGRNEKVGRDEAWGRMRTEKPERTNRDRVVRDRSSRPSREEPRRDGERTVRRSNPPPRSDSRPSAPPRAPRMGSERPSRPAPNSRVSAP